MSDSEVEVELEALPPQEHSGGGVEAIPPVEEQEHGAEMRGSLQDVLGAALRSAGLRAPKTPAREQSIADGAQGILFAPASEKRREVTLLPRLKKLRLCLALVVGLLVYLIPIMDNHFAQRCLAVLVTVSILWALEALPLFVTSLLIPLLVVWLKVLPDPEHPGMPLSAGAAAGVICEKFWGPVIFLFLGGFTIAAALSKYGLSRALATRILSWCGTRPYVQVAAVMALCAGLSAFISNPAASVLCVSVVSPIFEDLQPGSRYPRTMLLAIAFGGNIGGMTTPIASPQNAIALSTLEDLVPPAPPITFFEWIIVAVPYCVVGLVAAFLLVYVILKPGEQRIPSIAFEGITLEFPHYFILSVSALTVCLWVLNGVTESFTGSIGITALIPVCLFCGTGYLSVRDFDSLAWSILMLMGGGLALGYAIQASELLDIVAGEIAGALGDASVWVIMLVFSALVLVVGTFISHTVSAIVILPIVAQVGRDLPEDHSRLLVFACVIMCSAAMALPVSSFPNANSFAVKNEATKKSRLGVADYLKAGIPMSLVLLFLAQTLLYGITYVLGF
mmetsp:Transcript_14052/g.55353  ORF Transcript_14052/g.55353 Transcript_14052/m.55353 type:complete len:563 (+) Transcript_14052:126-1814(+)|eukprot:CAMPEP_0114611952 /NCGR_PEP_ID=MMETSP0168-20121206/4377_1 /TAXON_ID=95228 ORGANISM="Vannella sp., Strain DIVA3 517/6/12" /NCGR_SAMPLE_ID=MMETSP0168 /ASSEMBLY_ACC=CAM_ASM_000044 /LENGTH=562 /DNA_ID=CAMNT_0001822933 /DNA_START=87 /DNA_END=1775 /DNA_ORIENTATION=+